MTVRARTSTLSVGGDELEVANIVVHEDFDKFILLNDIALIKVRNNSRLVISIFVEQIFWQNFESRPILFYFQ